MKKNALIVLGAALVPLLAGCATTEVALAPVGPNPNRFPAETARGQLEVFSALSGRVEGDDLTWYQHSDYYICNDQGKRLEHVDNSVGHYTQRPRIISLPPGKYIVEARAKDFLRINVPIVVKSGEATIVHLDGQWQPPEDSPKMEVVSIPGDYPVGWRAYPAK